MHTLNLAPQGDAPRVESRDPSRATESAPSTTSVGWRATLRDAACVAALASIVFLCNLGGPSLWDDDEPRNAGCAQEMQARNDWIVPTFNGRLRTDKPILIYWLMRSAYAVFGVSEFSARFWSALLSIGTVLLTWRLGRVLFGPRAGLWAGIVLATSFLFSLSARAATTDATLVFFTTLALSIHGGSLVSSKASRGTLFATYAALGLAVLAKGPVGLVLPVAVMILTAWRREAARSRGDERVEVSTLMMRRMTESARREFRLCLRGLSGLRPVIGVAIAAAIALPWYIAVGLETNWLWPIGFLAKHNVNRFLHVMEGHSGPFFYYIPTLIVGTIPWSVPAWSGLVNAVRNWRRDRRGHTVDLFLLSWIGVYLVFFSMSRTKLPSYVLPCFPALALLAGRVIDGWLADAAAFTPRLRRTVFGGFCLMGLGGFIVVPVVAWIYVPSAAGLAWVGCIPLAGGAAALYLARRGRATVAWGAYSLTAAILLVSIHGVAMDQIAARQNSKPLLSRLRVEYGEIPRLATFGPHKPSLVYYSQARVLPLHSPDVAAAFLRSWPDACLVTRADLLEELQPLLPPGIDILERQPMFLRHHREVIVLGRATERMARR
jgi:4-amino-4-deoxy-L-arabinose transferase-like glycosyltransferase